MKNKIFLSVLSLAFILGFGFVGVAHTNAQTATFPPGCSSALAFSVTTGLPCNGTSVATMVPPQGCSTVLGYSVTSGVPCSGSSVAIFHLAGCTSINGFSTITARPCNGTNVASGVTSPVFTFGDLVIDIGTPGLPTTGGSGSASGNILFLLAAALAMTFGFVYLARNSKTA